MKTIKISVEENDGKTIHRSDKFIAWDIYQRYNRQVRETMLIDTVEQLNHTLENLKTDET